MNIRKTKTMRNRFAAAAPVAVGAFQLEDVKEYVYLGLLITAQNELKPGLARRRRAGRAAFGSIRSVIDATRDVELRAELFDSTVLPALCYCAETWSLTKALRSNFESPMPPLGIDLSALPYVEYNIRDLRGHTTRHWSTRARNRE
ncbi:Putative uncharacterized transposon-derived protein F52C9.6 [Zootermopsis nevadensis]|uniref:Uncharacterized transposon-derived protein F52C9.6 n=1 Tax=Zootermopsis nevadensis TaxID=136037 RepID=A0A067QFD5_ZOONE|nr:Putative uncharacterized transposon-derived protein F52C9.6 [Zootermopsis nevadensis]